MGLPQERHFTDAGETSFTTATSDQFAYAQSIVAPILRSPWPTLATHEQREQAISAARHRAARVTLPTIEAARRELAGVIGSRAPYEWERALAQLPVNGKAHVRTWNTILGDEHLAPRLKAELAYITAVNNQAWYAAAHAAHRLKQLGAPAEDCTHLFVGHERSIDGATAAYRLAVKITTDPHLITDTDVARVREHFSDAETAEIIQVICMANLFDRFTESLGLPLEGGIYQHETAGTPRDLSGESQQSSPRDF
jgi:alkylhydroperoxidase family enzyme